VATVITCQELVELVTDCLGGELEDDTRLRCEEHLTACPGRVTDVDQRRETPRLLGKLEEHHRSDAARTRLLDPFGTWASGRA